MSTQTTKSNAAFIGSLTEDVLNRKLIIEGEETRLQDFLTVNLLENDVEHIALTDAEKVVKLNIDEAIYINISEIKRLA